MFPTQTMTPYHNPSPNEWAPLLARPVFDASYLFDKVRTIMETVKANGDEALRAYALQFDGVVLDALAVSARELAAADALVPDPLKAAIHQAAANIRRFHEAQHSPVEKIESMPGVQCWRQSVGIEKVGLYIPGGSAPLFSTLLMLAIPAQLAGCRQVVVCTPPQPDGSVHPAILYAAKITGIYTIVKAGGAQAVAALVHGTPTVPAVYKIFGPGNQYVTAAKQLAQLQGLAIDMPAGPSELCILADATANAQLVAADLLSQAEHGPDSQVLLVTTCHHLPAQVQTALQAQLAALPRRHLAEKALANSRVVFFDNMSHALDLVNAYAAEHLIIACHDAETIGAAIVNAGSVFLGHHTPESVGDYASGTNHTLPTNGYARMYSGVSLDSFVKKITFQKLTPAGLASIAPIVVAMAQAEGLEAHARAVTIRLATTR
jgi:histidinol dehydrogenase